MKWPALLLSIVIPGLAGWWGGKIFFPVGQPAAAVASSLPEVARSPAPVLADVLAVKAGTTEGLRERMAGLARLGMADAEGLRDALAGAGEGAADARRDAARALAMASPEACWNFIKMTWPDDAVNQRAFCEDAAAWSYERDPAAGLAFLTHLSANPPEGLGSDTAGQLVGKALEAFPRKDLPVLQAWLEKQAPGALKETVVGKILPSLAAEDYPAALRLARSSLGEASADHLLTVITGDSQSWATQDARLAQLTEVEQQSLLPEMIASRTWASPETAAAQLHRLSGKVLQETSNTLFERWGARDPLRASRGIASLPAEAQPGAAAAVVENWAPLNQGAASGWVAALPVGENREAAVRGLGLAIATTHPGEALTWAASLTDPAKREETLKVVWKKASAKNPITAREALAAANLPPADQARLQSPNP